MAKLPKGNKFLEKYLEMEIGKKIEWNGKGSKSKPITRDPLRFSSHSFSTHKCKFSFSKRLKQPLIL